MKPGRIETILKSEKNWESARNKALNIVGNLGADSTPVIGGLEASVGNGKIIGRQSKGWTRGLAAILEGEWRRG